MSLDAFMANESDVTRPGQIDYPLSKVAQNEWKGFALYTVESRAIPSAVDGLKPSQRFYLYSSILNTPRDFKKVESVSGTITDYGYNHGTGSAAGAGQLMAAEWNNNINLVEGRGSFGTRLVQSAAAPRYTQTRLHPNFYAYMKDLDLSPKHPDPEHQPPSFYIPIVPLVLANGVKGIATGFATNILPRDPIALANACEEYITTGKLKTRPAIKFPHFTGKVVFDREENRYHCYGTFEKKSKTSMMITEVPYGFDRVSYIKILDDLEDKDLIVGYEDLCDKKGFCFDIKLKQATSATWSDGRIIKEFKLSKPHTENLTVIDHTGNLKEYTDERDIIIDFVNFRNGILQQRIDLRIKEQTEEVSWLNIKMEFIQSVLDEKIKFKGQKKAEISTQIMGLTSARDQDDCDRLLRINIMSLTDEMVQQLKKEIAVAKKNLKYWEKTTGKEQFLDDLNDLKTKE
jgi:DNA gyrase/topoisomerase IV subunit A